MKSLVILNTMTRLVRRVNPAATLLSPVALMNAGD